MCAGADDPRQIKEKIEEEAEMQYHVTYPSINAV